MKFLRAAIVLLALLYGCGGSKLELKKQPYNGQDHLLATKDQIISRLQKTGQFKNVQTSGIDTGYEVVTSKDDRQFFVKDGKVVSYIRQPEHNENKLIYWRQKFRGHLYHESEVPSDGLRGHHLPLRSLASDELHVGVVYDPDSETVTRVFHYDRK